MKMMRLHSLSSGTQFKIQIDFENANRSKEIAHLEYFSERKTILFRTHSFYLTSLSSIAVGSLTELTIINENRNREKGAKGENGRE